jgi:hypothetical protein
MAELKTPYYEFVVKDGITVGVRCRTCLFIITDTEKRNHANDCPLGLREAKQAEENEEWERYRISPAE